MYTIVHNFWTQDYAATALFCEVLVWIRAHGLEARMIYCVFGALEFFSAAGDVCFVEDSGGGCGDGFLEEGAVQHPHGEVDGGREHVV